MQTQPVSLVGMLVLVIGSGCGSDSREAMTPSPTPTPTPTPTPMDAPDATVPAPMEPAGCNDLAQGIYVATRNGHLVQFDPETATFGAARPLCPEVDGNAVAMSIDRAGHAWIVFSNGLLYDMDLESGACTVASDAPLADPYWWYWSTSLSFVSDGEGSAEETLFYSFVDYAEEGPMAPCGEDVTAEDGRGWCRSRIGTIDRSSGTLAPLPSMIEPPLYGLNLAGTGGGELWGLSFEYVPTPDGTAPWYGPSTPVLLRLDDSTGAIAERFEIPALTDEYGYWWGEDGYGGGLAFWGGRFYVFLHHAEARSASVHRFDPATGTLETIMAESGLLIADVGVSTCAPLDII